MAATHALAGGMGGIRTAGDLVARMMYGRSMKLGKAKEYVARKLARNTQFRERHIGYEGRSRYGGRVHEEAGGGRCEKAA